MNRDEYAASVEHLVGFPYMRWWHADALSDRRVTGLPEKLSGAYPWILSVAAASPLPGALADYDGSAMDTKSIATASGLPAATVKAFLAAALDRGIVDVLDEGIQFFPAFAGRQITAIEVRRIRGRKERAKKAAEDRWAAERARADAEAHANAYANGTARASANADA